MISAGSIKTIFPFALIAIRGDRLAACDSNEVSIKFAHAAVRSRRTDAVQSAGFSKGSHSCPLLRAAQAFRQVEEHSNLIVAAGSTNSADDPTY
jgi:hypothetical protein